MLSILASWKCQMKIPRHDAIKRNTYFTNTSLLLYFSAPGERQLASNRTSFSGEKEMVTILLERREFIRAIHFTSADLFLVCSLAMAVGSKLWARLVDNLLPLTAVLLKGQSDCENPTAKIWPPTRTPVRDCIRPYFSERPTRENMRAILKFGLIAGYVVTRASFQWLWRW